LDEWPVAPSGDSRRFTTVARWRGSGPHGALEAQGIVFGQKADEFAKVIELPTRVPATFELALDIDSGDTEAKQALSQNGWKLVDPREVASGPGDFREYVQASAAEFSVAKGAYAATNSGWFSDRTTRYLASGKPALVQNTGFGERIPVGDGLLSFVDADDAVAGAQRILADYEHHAKAAREVAENYFASDDVLGRFVADVRAARPV
jgi:hypothetical protein